MRSKSRRHQRSVSPANVEPPRFMKIILPGNIHAQNMRIPKEFVRRFENELATSEATICVPDGRVWKMELKKSENETWFCKGWEEFVKYYSISFGFFLVFTYEGNSQFNVVIFDSSAAEIHYKWKDNSDKHDPASECSKKSSPSFDQCGTKVYNTRSQRNKVEDEDEIIDIEDENALSHGKSGNKDRSGQEETDKSRKREEEKERPGQGHCSQVKRRTLSRKQRALEAAQNFKPKEPHFRVTIRPANLNRHYVDVPGPFWKEYMGKMSRPIKLQDCDGRKWEVSYSKRVSTIRILGGWTGFARANNLKEGDVCVFELIKRNNYFLFKVAIFAC